MDGPNDISLPPATPWLSDKATRAICAALGGQIYFVGGCVRDALLHQAGSDVDMATPLRPEQVTDKASANGFKVVPTGLAHGTVTIVAHGLGYEVTTFRRDVETDGRRAVVAFSEDMRDDARRRDFTLNALYATPEGHVIDPLGDGIRDCLDRRIRFIEDADTRIREDYLRILRYFRFHATYAAANAGFDPDALNAIAANSAGLETLSAERIGTEMLKLLSAADPAPAIAAMRQTGCLLRVLPGADDRYLGPVVHIAAEAAMPIDGMLRLAALGGDAPADRLRLSRENAKRLRRLSDAGYGATPLAEIAYRDGVDVARGAAVLRAALSEKPLTANTLAQIDAAGKARFPITAGDLMDEFSGKALGDELARLEALWIGSGFTLSRQDLLSGR
jgi:poly(A) polymerase/tRNA nucleotidyltransferase (CCA-adding enzyme)